jgi:hypothetical protein
VVHVAGSNAGGPMAKDLRIAALILAVPIIPSMLSGWYLEPTVMALIEGPCLQQNG